MATKTVKVSSVIKTAGEWTKWGWSSRIKHENGILTLESAGETHTVSCADDDWVTIKTSGPGDVFLKKATIPSNPSLRLLWENGFRGSNRQSDDNVAETRRPIRTVRTQHLLLAQYPPRSAMLYCEWRINGNAIPPLEEAQEAIRLWKGEQQDE